MMTANTLYTVLGVAPDAGSEEIDAIFRARELALQGQADELSLLRCGLRNAAQCRSARCIRSQAGETATDRSQQATKVEKYARLDGEDACLLFAPGAGNDSLAWGSSDSLRPGDTVHTMGHPGGSSSIIWSEGQFRMRVNRGRESVLVSNNYCRPGSSGGPLLDSEGRLVGVVSQVQVRARDREPVQYGDCISVPEASARVLLGKPLFPIALAPAQYLRND